MPSIAQPATDGRRQELSALKPTVELYELLWGEPGSNPARTVLMAGLHLDANAADFLASVTYWYLVMGESFYKFNKRPEAETPLYRDGDSWLEELGVGRTAFYRARGTVATKNTTGSDYNSLLGSTDTQTLVIYWTTDQDGTRLTWYDLRLDLLCQKLGAALGLTVVATQRPPATRRTLPTLLDRAEPAVNSTGVEQDAAITAEAGQNAAITAEATPEPISSPIAEAQGQSGQSAIPALPMKSAKPAFTYSSEINKEEEENRDSEAVIHIAQQLQQQRVRSQGEEAGVFPRVALEIARRAHQHGLDAAETTEVFEGHVAELRRVKRGKKASELVAMTVMRLLEWPLVRLPDVETLDPSRYRFLTLLQDAEKPLSARDSADSTEGETRVELTLPTEEPERPEEPVDPLPRLWDEVLQVAQRQMTRATFDTFVKDTRLVATTAGRYTIAARPQSLPWLENRLYRPLQRVLNQIVGEPVTLEFVTHTETAL